jgi:uncharacterized membrane protein
MGQAPTALAGLVAEDKPCHDGSTGAYYSQTVTVTVEGRVYRGCGAGWSLTATD